MRRVPTGVTRSHFVLAIVAMGAVTVLCSATLRPLLDLTQYGVLPFVNVAQFAVATAIFVGLPLLFGVRKPRRSFGVPAALLLFGCFALALVNLIQGVAYENPLDYVFVRFAFFVVAGAIFVIYAMGWQAGASGGTAWVAQISVFLVVFAALSFALDVTDYQTRRVAVVMAAVVLLAPEVAGRRKALALVALAAVFLADLDNVRRVEMASAVLTFCLAVWFYGRRGRYNWLLLLSLVAAVAAGLVIGLVDFDLSANQSLRRLRELSDLWGGRMPLRDMVAIYQRIQEMELVDQARAGADGLTLLFGNGFGATLDMYGTLDETVHVAAYEGAGKVHNIHFLPYAVLYRHGLVGLALLTVVVGAIGLMTTMLFRRGRRHPPIVYFCGIYSVVTIFDALLASNLLFADFLWPACTAIAYREYRSRREGLPSGERLPMAAGYRNA